MIRKITSAFFVLGFAFAAQSQTILLEEDFNSGIPANWTTINEDGLIAAEDVSEFTSAWIGFISGIDTAAASTSYYTTDESANDFLVTPKVAIGNFSKIVWDARSVDASYPDGYQVLISTTDSLASSFTDTLLTVDAETAYFTKRSIELNIEGYANQEIFIAFRNNTTGGYILLVDNVKILGAETAGVIEKEISRVQLYPNPSADFVQIKTEQKFNSASFYSSNGKLVLSSTTANINVQDLPKGIYYVLVDIDNSIKSVKFVKL